MRRRRRHRMPRGGRVRSRRGRTGRAHRYRGATQLGEAGVVTRRSARSLATSWFSFARATHSDCGAKCQVCPWMARRARHGRRASRPCGRGGLAAGRRNRSKLRRSHPMVLSTTSPRPRMSLLLRRPPPFNAEQTLPSRAPRAARHCSAILVVQAQMLFTSSRRWVPR